MTYDEAISYVFDRLERLITEAESHEHERTLHHIASRSKTGILLEAPDPEGKQHLRASERCPP